MALRGGYKIIDLKGKPLTPNVGMVYEGIYESIEETRKPILLTGLAILIDGNIMEYKDTYVLFYLLEGQYIATLLIEGITITVTDNDIVTITA